LGDSGVAAVDIGAGAGAMSLPLAEKGLRVTAVDPARGMLKRLRGTAQQLGLEVACVHAAAESIPLPGGAYGLAVLADSLQWVQLERSAAEVRRLLAEGGACAVVEPLWAQTPFMNELEKLIAKQNPRSQGMRRRSRARQFLSLVSPKPELREERVEDALPLDGPSLVEILRTHSFLEPALGPERFRELCERASEMLSRHDEAAWAREIVVTWARADPRPCR
jgi:ubiquinone/menaquinone biosynthesis C-methylase UbiE